MPLTSDDIARLFVEWIDKYHESHFQILAYVARHAGCTRRDLGFELCGRPLPEDASPQAGLFRELYRELNMGGLVRQTRQIQAGRFLKKTKSKPPPKVTASPYVDTSFDDEDELELTELGAQFVQYVLTGTVDELTPPER